MAKKFNKNYTQNVETCKQSYYMYKNGDSYWGIGIIRKSEKPIECSSDVHMLTKEEKVAWYEENK